MTAPVDPRDQIITGLRNDLAAEKARVLMLEGHTTQLRKDVEAAHLALEAADALALAELPPQKAPAIHVPVHKAKSTHPPPKKHKPG